MISPSAGPSPSLHTRPASPPRPSSAGPAWPRDAFRPAGAAGGLQPEGPLNPATASPEGVASGQGGSPLTPPVLRPRANPGRSRELRLPPETLYLEDLPPVQGDFPPPPPALTRPVLLVHGFNQSAQSWWNLRNYLMENPQNRFGATYHADREDQFRQEVRRDPGARIFAITFSDPHASYRQNARELARAIDIIRQETGAAEIDLVAHSMGGLACREYLDGPQDGVRRLIMAGTPNHGSLEADLAQATDQLKLYHQYPPGARQALQDLGIDVTFLGRPNNPHLHELNERWPRQRAKAETTIIAGVGIPTPDLTLSLTSTGDGLVTAASAYLPDCEYLVADEDIYRRSGLTWKYNHGNLLCEPRVLQFIGQVLGRP